MPLLANLGVMRIVPSQRSRAGLIYIAGKFPETSH